MNDLLDPNRTVSDDARFQETVAAQWRENLKLLGFEDNKISRMDRLIEWAKRRVENNYKENYGGDPNRPWHMAYADSYEDPSYRIALFVLEGSPAKGWFIVNFGTETATCFDCHDKKLCTKTRWNLDAAKDLTGLRKKATKQ